MKDTDRGIFLQRTTFSDSSLIVAFYTQKNGLQKFVFRGGKKKAHNIFPMAVSELTFYGRKESDLLNLTKVESVRPQTFQFDPVKGAIAFFMAEILRKCSISGQPEERFFLFMEHVAQQLEEREVVTLFPLEFLIACSDQLGFMPLSDDENATVFNLDAGTFQKSSSESYRTYRGAAVDLIKGMIDNPMEAPEVSRAVREEALDIMLQFFGIHVPRFGKLDAYDIVREVLRA